MSDKPHNEQPAHASEPAPKVPPVAKATPTNAAANEASATAGADEALAERVAALETELAEAKNQWLRTAAELDNARKRHSRELEEARTYAMSAFARDLLDVADSLQRAQASITDEMRAKDQSIDNLATGVQMTEKALLSAFERHAISRISPQPGETFDANVHQAMYEVETAEVSPGHIAQVMADGYRIGTRVLRAAMVGVAKRPAGSVSSAAPASTVPPTDTAA